MKQRLATLCTRVINDSVSTKLETKGNSPFHHDKFDSSSLLVSIVAVKSINTVESMANHHTKHM